MKFNADYYIFHMLDPLAEWQRCQVAGSDRRLHVHANNARPHTAKKVTEFLAGNGMKRVPHLPDSPDLALCGFYLFGYIKGRLAGASFEESDQLLRAIDAFFRSGWTDWCNVVRQLVVSSQVRKKKSEGDPSFTRPVSRC
jgi:hypothetical protein